VVGKRKDTQNLAPGNVSFSDRPYRLIKPEEAAERTEYSKKYLRDLRLSQGSGLIEGIHWERLNSRNVRYRSPLIEHWAENRNKPIELSRAIDQFLEWDNSKC
jgi:hypothetical protein